MEAPPNRRLLLFLNADSRNFTTQRRTRDKSLDSKVRRHVMVDIGKSRRKPSKSRQFDSILWSAVETSELVSSAPGDDDSTAASGDAEHSQVSVKDLVVPETAMQYSTSHSTKALTLHALYAFEKEWGEDMFSAYGLTLIMVAGRNAMRSPCSTDTFWFPFAFRKSAFLHHYQQTFTSPNILIPLYRKSARELQSMALERSLETIQCVEARISSPDASIATSDIVLHAVLAMICYNFTSLDFDQAMIHVKGLRMVIVARGGMSGIALEENQDLMLIISWVDITAALLHDTRPLFPLCASMANTRQFRECGLGTLPTPLISVLDDENRQNSTFMAVMSCFGDLNALAALFKSKLATRVQEISGNDPALRLVRLWLLILCSISEPNDDDLKTSMKMLASSDEIEAPRSVSWVEVMSDVRQMPWVNIFEPPCARLEQQLFP
ncbi:hypothetical protein DHEL01_v204659 [Diaporthe helianthi]|uniref:Uncharacterized protein n=1 Tax=Diaporthe helianthi TaxID=158607 RepID=A0A2P5I376_DIAHE|nr:hypothetical protein DHEL01_v204659 [Diaporthe helianthi]